MMKKLVSTFALATALTSGAFAMPVDEVVAKANHAAYYQGADGKAKVSMTITDTQGRTRTREFTILRRDGEPDDAAQKFYVYFRGPADVAKTVFMVWKKPEADDDRWMYLPALDLVKRIAASDERTSFVGSHFFYEDVSGRSPEEDNHELVEETDNYYVLKNTPKDKGAVEFDHYIAYIHKATFLPVQIKYFDEQGENYRTYDALKVDMVNGIPTVTAARMSDSRIGGSTEMRYSDVSYDQGIDEDIFSERYLRNPPRRELR
ncbi:outer membrane lipoprotein-sorting protein [Kordiimonas lipolytica]|uniref:Outer membrane lipoprotein-sorting protein n=1 Tax=Kordiimonas lipolytica TaxID=1662421 RepID=A0ABV8UDF3_9PROT|nr:outer membrane lipoprotein-sorting protein [Kordiimonas lipolytica]